jgi:hypothetical protein
MIEKKVLAKLRISPCYGAYPLKKSTFRLVQIGSTFQIEGTMQVSQARSHWVVKLSTDEVIDQLEKINKATLPAFPVSPMVCDGEDIELTIYGICSVMTLSWLTAGPKDADVLIDFADWLKCSQKHYD